MWLIVKLVWHVKFNCISKWNISHILQNDNYYSLKSGVNKKVLLRERKRHTARCVANTPYVVLTGYPPPGGTWSGTPPPPPPGGTWSGGVPGQVPWGVPRPPRGYPVRYPPGEGGYPDPPGGVPGPPLGGTRSGTPRGGTRSGTPPGGYPVRYPPGGVPSPPPPLWTDKHLWKQYLPVVLRTRAVKITHLILLEVAEISSQLKQWMPRFLIGIHVWSHRNVNVWSHKL